MRFACTMLLYVLCNSSAWASSLLVTVTDSEGNRLEHAVISIHGKVSQMATGDAALAVMDQRERQFAPSVLPIQQGTKVSFPNSDDVRHHVYSFSYPNNFELKLYHGEKNKPISFDEPGIVVLGCNIHDGMIGYLQVVDTPWFSKTEIDGLASIDQIPGGNYTLQVWHPDLGMNYEHQKITLTEGHQAITVRLPTGQRAQTPKPEVSPLQALFDD
ncbi:methylamine utilization protein [Granulosicoccus antarcticus]|uniref:Methylamine utilization protein n=1 Tax=Granulosicoccus antarcticus IMCC3135 TaxID=1192854 RepID=A0A2Z2NUW6_9GAMM|nr:methylamine utilization protein [Granulosicoccus antarcticus]ASJ71457.1 hypothetical protein IMCC3135_06750 [Granulosicoccus antarcticus IMCC3135]